MKDIRNSLLSRVLISRIAVVACLVLLPTALIQAQPNPGMSGHGGKHRLNMMASDLGLSDAQVALLQEVEELSRNNRTELRDLQQQLHELAHSDYYSDAEAQQIVGQITVMMAEDMTMRATAENAFYSSLTEEQKTTLADMKSKQRKLRRPL